MIIIKKLKTLFESYTLLSWIIIIEFLTWITGAVTLYFFERASNPDFDSIFKSTWGIVVYLLSGLEEYVPITAGGKVTAVIVLIVGAVGIAILTSALASILVERARWKNRVPPKPARLKLNNHIVICNWNELGPDIVRQVHHKEVLKKRQIVIVGENVSNIHIPTALDKKVFKRVYHFEGYPSDDKILRSVNAEKSFSTIILGSSLPNQSVTNKVEIEQSVTPSDAGVILTSLAVETHKSDIHTIAQLNEMENKKYLEKTNVNEIVSINEISAKLLAQTVINPGVVRVYKEILTFEKGNEIYFEDLNDYEKLTDYSFKELEMMLKDEPVILLGISIKWDKPKKRAGRTIHMSKVICNPEDSKRNISIKKLIDDDRNIKAIHEERKIREKSVKKKNLILLAYNRKECRRALSNLEKEFNKINYKREKSALRIKSENTKSGDKRKINLAIFNWSVDGRELLKQIDPDVIGKEFDIWIVSNDDNLEKDLRESEDIPFDKKHIHLVKNDPLNYLEKDSKKGKDTDIIKELKVKGFKCEKDDIAVVLSDSKEGTFSDGKSLLIALKLEEQNPHMTTYVQIINSKNRIHFEDTTVNEVICSEEIAENLIAQSALNPGMTQLYYNLLTTEEVSNELYVIDLPDVFKGKSFNFLKEKIVNSNEDIILLGIVHSKKKKRGKEEITDEKGNPIMEDEVIINPKDDLGFKEEDKDEIKIIVMAHNRPDLSFL